MCFLDKGGREPLARAGLRSVSQRAAALGSRLLLCIELEGTCGLRASGQRGP